MEMRFKWMVILSLQITYIGVSSCVAGEDDSISRHKVLEVDRKTNSLKRNAVRSIWSEDGDIIDCIDIYKQPAFDHPALRNHTIQMTPSYDRTKEKTATTKTTASWKRKEDSPYMTVRSQLWQNRGRCPRGTIPIRRIRKKDKLKANPIDKYGRKKPSHHIMQFNDTETLYLANHSLAVLLTQGYNYSGAKGEIRVWTPYVESEDEYSTSQVSLKNGPSFNYEAIESGWAVNPSVYGDKQTRLFVYWTADASRTTGCFDVTCPGFVQTNSEIALGAAIYPISNPTGLPYQITIYIFKDPKTSNWWVQYGERVNIGYWPPDLFSLLKYQATMVQWGGEVYSSKVGTHPHTATGMGSGKFPDYIFGDSGYVKRIRIEENSHELKFPEWVVSHADEYDCYDVFYLSDYVEDPEFYYGGPGRNAKCP